MSPIPLGFARIRHDYTPTRCRSSASRMTVEGVLFSASARASKLASNSGDSLTVRTAAGLDPISGRPPRLSGTSE